MGDVVVCMKWVALRPDVDPLTGAVESDDRWEGPSLADQAALEWGLLMAARNNTSCTVVTVGAPAADAMLRDALAAGAAHAVRVDVDASVERQPTSASVAAMLASVIAPTETSMVLCGDWSLDRGSASVPPFLSALLGLDAACGLVRIAEHESESNRWRVERRLDGGRREVLDINGPAVLSVEGVTATLRRASLAGVRRAATASIQTVTPSDLEWEPSPLRIGPYRPRARILDAPASADPRKRVEELTGALVDRVPPTRLTLAPEDAADLIIERLRSWGQLPM
jgi:electron transfer flavoprotein beta subunit